MTNDGKGGLFNFNAGVDRAFSSYKIPGKIQISIENVTSLIGDCQSQRVKTSRCVGGNKQ